MSKIRFLMDEDVYGAVAPLCAVLDLMHFRQLRPAAAGRLTNRSLIGRRMKIGRCSRLTWAISPTHTRFGLHKGGAMQASSFPVNGPSAT